MLGRRSESAAWPAPFGKNVSMSAWRSIAYEIAFRTLMSSKGLMLWLMFRRPMSSGDRVISCRPELFLMSVSWFGSTKSIVSTVPDSRAVSRWAESAMGLKITLSRWAALALSQ